MRKMIVVMLVVVSMALAGCSNSPKQPSNVPTDAANNVAGQWTINVSPSSDPNTSSFDIALAPEPCTFGFVTEDLTAQGPNCFTGTGNAGPTQDVLLGTAASVATGESGAAISVFLMAMDSKGNPVVFNGQGQIYTYNEGLGSMQGTWVCNPDYPACAGLSGSFTGTQQNY